jgi:hypothetical protein
MSGKWLVLEPLTNYLSNGESANVNIAFELNMASDTLCNYFGKDYFQFAGNELPFEQEFESVALTAFPGYLGAKEGDNLFLSLVGASQFSAPANVEVCPGGQTAKIYTAAFCFAISLPPPGSPPQNICDSKNVVHMAKFPNSETEIVGKTWEQLVRELAEQTDDDLQIC